MREKLEQNPEMIPNAVQEIIRWQTSLAHMRRTVTEDHEMFGHQVKEGDSIILWSISANRNENFSIGRTISGSNDPSPAGIYPSIMASIAASARGWPNCSCASCLKRWRSGGCG